jgi:hypothetical protein
MTRYSIMTIGLLAALAVPATAQEQYALQMKYVPGDQHIMHVNMTGVGTLMVEAPGAPNTPSDLWMNADVEIAQEINSVDERGTAQTAFTLKKLDAEIQVMGMRQVFTVEDGHMVMSVNDQVVLDSLDPEQTKKNPMLAMLGQSFIIQMDRTGKVIGMPQFELVIQMMMPGTDLRAAFEKSTGPLPPGPVKIGDTWEERQVWPYGAPEGQEPPTFTTLHTFSELADVAGHQCANIASTSNIDITDVELPVPTMMMMPGTGVQDMRMVINKMVMDMAGDQNFDIERGLALNANGTITLNLDMTQWMKVQMPQPKAEKAAATEGEAQAAEPELQEIEVHISIEDLFMDVAMELAQ